MTEWFLYVRFFKFIDLRKHQSNRKSKRLYILIHITITLLRSYLCVQYYYYLLDSMYFFFKIPWYKTIKRFFEFLAKFCKTISWKISIVIFFVNEKYICCSGFSRNRRCFYKIFFLHECVHQAWFSYIWSPDKYYFSSIIQKNFSWRERNWLFKCCFCYFHITPLKKYCHYHREKAQNCNTFIRTYILI